MRTQKRHIIILLAFVTCLIGWGNVAQAADYDYDKTTTGTTTLTLTSTNGNKFKVNGGSTVYDNIGNINVSDGTLKIVFNTTGIVHVTGRIKITKGTLNLSCGSDATYDHTHLKRHKGNLTNYLIEVSNSTSTISNCKLIITGKDSSNLFTIHGNANWTINSSHQGVWQGGNNGDYARAQRALIHVHGGSVSMDYVKLQYNWNESTTYGSGIRVTDDKSGSQLTINNSELSNLYDEHRGAAFMLDTDKNSWVKITNSTIKNNCANSSGSSDGGCIRCYGASYCTLEMTDCTLSGNCSNLSGGAIHWNCGVVAGPKLTRCTVQNNWTGDAGGGIYCLSGLTLVGCTIKDNTAVNNGGGIYYGTYGSNTAIANFAPKDGTLTLDSGTKILNNTATSGGGIYVLIKPMVVGGTTIYNNDQGQTYSVNLNINGTTIQDNTASSHGGGIYMTRETTIYNTNINLNYGTIDNNTASGNGGGLCVNPNSSGGVIPVNVGSNSGTITITNNKAVLGAGMYVSNGNITLTGGNIGASGKANASSSHGGGIYITGSSSVINITGGNIQYNTASGNGGGIYVNNSSSAGTSITGSAKVQYNQAVYGAGAYINAGKLTINGSNVSVNNNTATTNGGGAYVNSGALSITSATIASNTAATHGGGIFVSSNGGAVTLSSATLSSNTATSGNGGGLCTNKSVTVTSSTFTGNKAANTSSNGGGGGIYATGSGTTVSIDGTSLAKSTFTGNQARLGGGVYATSSVTSVTVGYATIGNSGAANTASQDGGGIYAAGPVTLNTGSVVQCNTATNDGGGVYVNNGIFTMTDGTIGGSSATYANTATGGNGGGVYITGANAKVVVSGGAINYNSAPSTAANKGNGGGIYVAQTGNDGTSISGAATITSNTAKQTGGGLYVANGTIAVSSTGGIKGNQAQTGNGGGIYMGGGSCSVTAGAIGASGSANQAVNGGGIYATGGTITVSGGNVNYNTASTSGGGIYSNAGTVTVSSGNVNNNTATTDGGGIYTKGTVNFSNGNIKNNAATNGNGGGVYIYTSGTLNVSGTAEISANTVQSGWGGGVYQGGTMYADGSSFKVINNTRNGSKATSGNNVYLPNGKTVEVGPHISTSVDMGVYTENIATVGNLIPVLNTVENGSDNHLPTIYNAMLAGTSNIHDDRHLHQPIYVGDDPTGHTLYFGFIQFDYPAYTEDFSNPIDSRAKLYQFMCWVNGVNGYVDSHPGAVGNVTADIDASNFIFWIPIGEANMIGDTDPYSGTFHGNGHVIDGLGLNDELYSNYGLFGTTEGANIDGVYLTNCAFTKNTAGAIGCIVGHMQGGSITNSTCSGTLTSAHADCIVGGMVGKFEKNGSTSGTIHSSYAGTNLTGYQMGGLVGDLDAGCNLYNSFANVSFTPQSGNTAFMGGLVAVNKGHVENCYAHLRGTAPSGNFGYLAGNNTNGTIIYCYAPDDTYTVTGKEGTLTGVSTFTPASIPYLYKHHDTQVDEVSGNNFITNANGYLDRTGLKGLLRVLNNWVNQDATHSGTYLRWMRTSASPINQDYPIHEYSNYVCVASRDNIGLEYSADFNDKFNKLLSGNSGAGEGTLYLYKSPTAAVTSTLSNSNKATELYIHEDVVMMHTSAINAHVGITLDNTAGTIGAHPSFSHTQDAIDWHFFSSALADAPIGLVYGDQSQYEAYHYPTWQAYFNDDDGYFPTNFNTSAPSSSDYYADWDLYAYFERCYHWINLKRNSASHWLEDWPGVNIPYENDVIFKPGKGYMVALQDEGYLQGYGTLNTNTGSDFLTVPVTYTPEIAWTTREGHNLLGNPYQSYLDFNAFARDAENAMLWNAGRTPFYIIMDEDKADYVLYTVGQSPNESQASRFLHPHQGFMIDVDKTGSARFCNDMRTTTTTVSESGTETTWLGYFRSESNPCYPLVNLFAADGYGNRDIVTVELGRPDKGGALKQDAWRTGKGSLWCRYEEEDYALVFTQPGLEYANIRFACDEDGEYTMTWNTQNGAFSYLHLIDNMTGTDIDCLSKSEYKFTARTSDYNSRFRLMFGYTGIEEPEVPEPVEGPACFAFIMNGELVVNGTGIMQLIDLNGRMLNSYNINDTQSTVALPDLPAGLYVLRLITENGTRTQKIILD